MLEGSSVPAPVAAWHTHTKQQKTPLVTVVAKPMVVTGGLLQADRTGHELPGTQHVSQPPSQLPGEGCQLAGCLVASCLCCGLETNAVTAEGTAGDSRVLCAGPAAQDGHAHSSLCWRCLQITAQAIEHHY